jgi:hypothetical protein
LNGLEALLFSTHALLAASLKIPELGIEQSEAKMLAMAVANVNRHYNVQVAQKTMDWANLVTSCCMIYGTRFATVRARRRGTTPAARAANGAGDDLARAHAQQGGVIVGAEGIPQ